MMSAANQSEFDAPNDAHCPQCAALLPVDAITCWLCFAPVEHQTLRRSPAGTSSVAHEATGGFSLASLMMFVTLVCVVLGLSVLLPGVGIPVGVVAFFAWFRTLVVVQERRSRRLPTSGTDKVVMFFSSIGAMLGFLVVALVAFIVAFFVICLAGGGPFDISAAVACIAAALIGLTTLLFVGRVIWSRWQRDVGQRDSLDPLTRWSVIVVAVSIVLFLMWLLIDL